MEKNNQLAKSGQDLTISGRELAIAEKVFLEIPMIRAYAMNADEAAMWAKDLDRMLPGEEMKKLPLLLDMFKMDELEWDRSKGIQNIFTGLKFIHEEDGKYVFKKPK